MMAIIACFSTFSMSSFVYTASEPSSALPSFILVITWRKVSPFSKVKSLSSGIKQNSFPLLPSKLAISFTSPFSIACALSSATYLILHSSWSTRLTRASSTSSLPSTGPLTVIDIGESEKIGAK